MQEYQLTRDINKRQIKSPKRYEYTDIIAYALAGTNDIDDEEYKSFKQVT